MSAASPTVPAASAAGRSVGAEERGLPGPGLKRDRRGPQLGFALIVFAFIVVMLGGTLPAPLYDLYGQRNGFGAGAVTAAFAIYSVGVLIAMVLLGRMSDSIGRRPVLGAALAVATASSALFALSDSTTALFAGRALSGVSVGLVTGAATAHLAELHPGAQSDGRMAALAATAANLGGLGLGSLISGGLYAVAGDPAVLPYLVHLVLLAGAVIAVARAPETVRDRSRPSLRPQRIALPAEGRASFATASIATGLAFAAIGVHGALTPSFLADELDRPSHALAGGVVFSAFAAAALAQTLLPSLDDDAAMRLGLLGIPVGLTLLVAGLASASLVLVVVSAPVGGAAVGLVFKAAIRVVTRMAPSARRAETVTGFFLVSYLGLIGPIIALGLAIERTSVLAAVLVYTALVGFSALAVRAGGRHTTTPGSRDDAIRWHLGSPTRRWRP